jgi:putative chitinase
VTYRVRAGDSLTSIARRFGVTVEAIQKANSIGDPDQIEIGQRLTIPARTATPKP